MCVYLIIIIVLCDAGNPAAFALEQSLRHLRLYVRAQLSVPSNG